MGGGTSQTRAPSRTRRPSSADALEAVLNRLDQLDRKFSDRIEALETAQAGDGDGGGLGENRAGDNDSRIQSLSAAAAAPRGTRCRMAWSAG